MICCAAPRCISNFIAAIILEGKAAVSFYRLVKAKATKELNRARVGLCDGLEIGRQNPIMNGYEKAAVEAAQWTASVKGRTPEEGWNSSVKRQFPGKTASQEKGCPRGAFLGLCQEGFVTGISPGNYTKSVKNKAYAVAAARLLFRQPTLAGDINDLWNQVMKGETKAQNGQMNVVVGLWNAGLLIKTSGNQSVA